METLGAILGSAARTDILRTLYRQPAPAGLRFVARIAGVHPHSAELALAALVKEGRVTRVAAAPRPLYALSRTHPDAALLASVFEAAERAHVQARRAALQQRARRLLPFMAEARRLTAHARRSRRVP